MRLIVLRLPRSGVKGPVWREAHSSAALQKKTVLQAAACHTKALRWFHHVKGSPMRKVRQPGKALTPPMQQRQPRLTSFQRELQRHMKCSAQHAAWFDALLSRDSPSKLDH